MWLAENYPKFQQPLLGNRSLDFVSFCTDVIDMASFMPAKFPDNYGQMIC